MSARRVDGRHEGDALHACVVSSQELVGSVLHPTRYICVGGAAIRRVVLKAAILGWIVRRRDHDAVREMLLKAAVIDENGSRDNWRWRDAIVSLNDCIDVVGSEYFQRSALRRV